MNPIVISSEDEMDTSLATANSLSNYDCDESELKSVYDSYIGDNVENSGTDSPCQMRRNAPRVTFDKNNVQSYNNEQSFNTSLPATPVTKPACLTELVKTLFSPATAENYINASYQCF